MAHQSQPASSAGLDTGTGPKDPTFRSYTASQAADYAKARPGYADELYQYVVDHHSSTGGQLGTLLDVGCGPGTATRDLAKFFDHAFGCDPNDAMIAEAKAAGYKTKSPTNVSFQVCPAEELDKLQGVEPGSVDMIVCAMSAHWFHLPLFYRLASHLLKPSGTLAMWTCGSLYIHPSTPNAPLIQSHLTHLETVTLAPFTTRGNMLSYRIYDDAELPWTYEPPICVGEFREQDLHRKAWNRNGEVGENGTFLAERDVSFRDLERALGTSSMVTRWREVNAGRVSKGELRDCVEETFGRVRDLMGMGDEEEIRLRTGAATGLVMLKRL